MGSFELGLVILFQEAKDAPGVAAKILGNGLFFILYRCGLEIFVKTPPLFVYYLLLRHFSKKSRGSFGEG